MIESLHILDRKTYIISSPEFFNKLGYSFVDRQKILREVFVDIIADNYLVNVFQLIFVRCRIDEIFIEIQFVSNLRI